MQLPFHTGIDGEVDDGKERVKQRPVFRQAVFVHGVGEGGGTAPVMIEIFSAEIDAGGFQETDVGYQSVLADFHREGNAVKMLFEKRPAKQFVAQAGGFPVSKVVAGVNHAGVDQALKLRLFIQPCRKGSRALDLALWGRGDIVTAHRVRAGVFCGAAHALIHGGMNPVVAVHEGDICAFGLTKAGLSG